MKNKICHDANFVVNSRIVVGRRDKGYKVGITTTFDYYALLW